MKRVPNEPDLYGDRSSVRVMPTDEVLESALIRACLDPVHGASVVGICDELGLAADHFALPSRAVAWEEIRACWLASGAADVQRVRERLHEEFPAWTSAEVTQALQGKLYEDDAPLAAEPMALDVGQVIPAVSRLARLAMARRAIVEASNLSEQLYRKVDPELAVEAHLQRMAEIGSPPAAVPADLRVFDEAVDEYRTVLDNEPWVIPWTLRRKHRVGIVAAEGSRKTSIARWIGACAAQGVHPFTLGTGYDPQRVLVVDLENPADHFVEVDDRIRPAVKRLAGGGYDPGRMFLLHREAGLDIIGRPADRAAIASTLRALRPDLVIVTPVYKIVRAAGKLEWETRAEMIQEFLDEHRDRLGFALILEHHAPGASGGSRELKPYGSQRWAWWGEFGFKLYPKSELENGRAVADPNVIVVDSYRGNRLKATCPGWPAEIHCQEGPFVSPFRGHFPEGARWEQRARADALEA